MEYVFLKRDKPFSNCTVSENIKDYQEKHRQQLLQLDKKVTAENRESLIADALSCAKVFMEGDLVLGYYIPCLKEGLIIAETATAGKNLQPDRRQFWERLL
jgi:hypothetical protein